jgi:hypothetical protein
VSQAEAENSVALASTHADAEGLAWKIILFEGELVEERRAWETSEREHRERLEEVTLLQTRGSELCHAIFCPPQARHLSKGMRLAALYHIEMAGELAAFWAAVSSTAGSVVGHSPSSTDHLDEAAGQLRKELPVQWEVEVELEALWSSIVWVQDLVLGDVDRSSLLATSMSVVAERLES